jgi:hypothetical protein
MRQLSAREFHQIAGRAGRAGYDTAGTVVVMAPEHEIENEAALRKATAKQAQNPSSKVKNIVRKKAPQGFVSWGEASFDKLVVAEPEPLAPQMQLTAAMLINVIARGGDVFANVRSLVFDNHEPLARRYELARRALAIFRTLCQAGIVEVGPGGGIRLTVDLQPNFALNQPLSPFALAAIELLDREDGPGAAGTGHYALDVLSVIEATLDDPRPVLSQQQFRARGEAVAAMKREGIEYDERMAALEEVTHPRPLAELLGQAYEVFASSQPWIRDFELSPKSVVRDMYERALSFGEFVSLYQLGRSEGLVLRYLSDAYRAIRQTVPIEAQTEDLLDVVAWLGELVRQVDSSLVDEWESLINPVADPSVPVVPPPPPSLVRNRRAFTVLVRNELFRRVRLAALQQDDELVELDPDAGWPEALDAYFDEHDEILTGGPARSPGLVSIDESDAAAGIWRVEQTIDDPDGNHDWRIRATVNLEASDEEGAAVLHVDEVLRL